MKKLSLSILLVLVSLLSFADSGHWNLYLSYFGTPQDIESADKFIYVQTNNSLYSYNRNDHSITYFSRANLLSDIEIQYIAWAKYVKKLVVVYKNGNIDFLCNDGKERENLSDYYTKTTTDDKTINSIYVKNNLLLLATNFGIVKIDTKKAEIMETYNLQQKFQKAAIDDNYVYALTANGSTLYKGSRKKNLIDPESWTQESFTGQVDFATINDEINAEDEAIVNTLDNSDCPKSNLITRLNFSNGKLYVGSGGWREGVEDRSASKKTTICEYSNGQWKHYQELQNAADITYYRPISDIVINPKNSNHIVFCTDGNGFYEYVDGVLKKSYTDINTSTLKSAVEGNSNYVITSSALFTDESELWLLNSYSPNPIVKGNVNSGEFVSFKHNDLWMSDNTGHAGLERMMLDSKGGIWFVNNNHTHPALFYYDRQNDKVTEYSNFTNQDGTSVGSVYYVRCVAEDSEGNIWVGTNQGPLLLDSELQANPSGGFIQVKVPRNDGTNFADYLLTGIDISCMAIDGGGRKWFGTNGNGIYVISADNMEQVEHFTMETSQLLSNDIIDIAINPQSGEVFVATENGLCSYIGDATMPNEEMTKDNVWAYPNPVSPDFTGDITICGLSLSARVIITTASGLVVADGISTGGSFKWNGCDKQGKRVASGIYMVHTATSEGESGVVCKVAVIR